jgi:predicted ester cyclase
VHRGRPRRIIDLIRFAASDRSVPTQRTNDSEAAFDLLESVSERDLVSSRYRFRARQAGELFGMPATGKSFEVDAIDMIRFRDGKILEHWGLIDMPAMIMQLGLMPAPGA